MSDAIKPTPGPWDYGHRKKSGGMWSTEVFCGQGEAITAIAWYPKPEIGGVTATYREDNARLIAEAGTVFHETALSPRQILEQRDELLVALKLAEAGLADIGDADREPGDDLAWCERRAAESLPTIRAALAKCQPKPPEVK